MIMQRYFALEKNENQMKLEVSDLYHIKRVMRMKNGEKIEVVYREELYLCEVQMKNEEVTIHMISKKEKKEEFMKPIVLIIPILKEQKMDLILQKATELGVSEIIPVIMKRSMVKSDGKEEKKLARWNKIIKEASEQSMRLKMPKLNFIHTLKEVSKLDGLKMICSTVEEKNTLKNFLQSSANYDKLLIVVGPEGGLDPEEEQLLVQNGFVSVTLGPRILRVETVPIYLLSILNYEYMEG